MEKAQGGFKRVGKLEPWKCSPIVEEMNKDLIEAHEKLKELSVKLFILNNTVLFMNSPVIQDQMDQMAAKYRSYHQPEE